MMNVEAHGHCVHPKLEIHSVGDEKDHIPLIQQFFSSAQGLNVISNIGAPTEPKTSN